MPKVSFTINLEKDIDTFFAFAGEKYDKEQILTWAIWKPHPQLRDWFDGDRLTVERTKVASFIKEEYTKNSVEIQINLRDFETGWREKERKFSELAEELFPGVDWPAGKYICSPTIWGMYPRFLEDKTFQIPWKHDKEGYVLTVISHEMLHFIWYARFYETHPQYKPNTQADFFVWHVSELFNSVVQGTPKWLSEFGQEPMTYPQHDAILAELKPKYANKIGWTADDLTKELIERVKKEGFASGAV